MNPDELRRWCIEKIINANPAGISWPTLLHDAACMEDWVLNGIHSNSAGRYVDSGDIPNRREDGKA